MKTNKIDFLQKPSLLSYLIFLTQPLISLGIGLYGFVLMPNSAVMLIPLFLFSIDFVPAFILTVDYLYNKENRVFRIMSKRIDVIKNKKSLSIENHEIQKIKFFCTKRKASGKWGPVMTSWEFFYYGKIILKTGEEYLFTCFDGLFLEKRLKKMKGVLYDKEARFPLIRD